MKVKIKVENELGCEIYNKVFLSKDETTALKDFLEEGHSIEVGDSIIISEG